MKHAWFLLIFLLGCQQKGEQLKGYQGVVEVEEIGVAFEVSGVVRSLSVKRGQAVERGAELARVDDAMELRLRAARAAEVEALRAELALALAGTRREEIRVTAARLDAARQNEALVTSQLTRQQVLVDGGAVPLASLDAYNRQLTLARAERRALSQTMLAQKRGTRRQQLDSVRARLAAAEAVLAAEDEKLSRYVLHAPAAAVVNDVHFEPGELAGPGAIVVTLGDNAHPFVDVFVPQQKLSEVKLDQPVQVRVDTLAEPLAGRVEYIWSRTEYTPRYLFSESERQNLVVRARIRIDDPKGSLPLGVPAFVTALPTE